MKLLYAKLILVTLSYGVPLLFASIHLGDYFECKCSDKVPFSCVVVMFIFIILLAWLTGKTHPSIYDDIQKLQKQKLNSRSK